VRFYAVFYNVLTNQRGFMRLRNNIFAAAFDYLKREKGVKTQKRLAELMGVSEDTITRILKDRCEVTEDIITKLQTASGCIFNLQWLRGEDVNCMLAEDIDYYKQHPEERLVFDKQQETTSPAPSAIDYTFLIEKAVEKATAYADKTIALLEKQLADKDKQLNDKDVIIKLLHEKIAAYESAQQIIESNPLRDYPFPIGVADKEKEHRRV
jgi:transcriptional regulator with XRE-family HTH domain